MDIQNAVARLKDEAQTKNLREALETWPDAQPGDVERVVKWAVALRDDLTTLISEIGDPEEVTMTVAINYIELKSRWIGLNTKMNYQTFRTGKCDSMTALRGAAISNLVGRIEELLTPGDIDQITQFLSEPVRRAA